MQHITVVPYQSHWEALYRQEAEAVRSILGEELISIHHIGSTAVPGLAAKPIIDMMAVVRQIDRMDFFRSQFQALGYEYMGEFGIPGRRYLRKGGEERTHQIHIFSQKDQPQVHRHLAFRDYLRACPHRAARYAALKKQLAKEHPWDIDGYCDGKDAFVKETERLALEWYDLKQIDPGLKLKKIREEPELARPSAVWFSGKWGVPEEAYLESMEVCVRNGRKLLSAENPGASAVRSFSPSLRIPQWYAILDKQHEIIAGAGLISNDFHNRPDLTPNLCALFVEEPWRNRGIAKYLLNLIRREAACLGFSRLYLVTDHTDFYEKCGWEFLTMVLDEDGMPERMYTAST